MGCNLSIYKIFNRKNSISNKESIQELYSENDLGDYLTEDVQKNYPIGKQIYENQFGSLAGSTFKDITENTNLESDPINDRVNI